MSEEGEGPGFARWPKWLETASRGDLIRLAVAQRSLNVKLGGVLVALMNQDHRQARQAYAEFLADDDELAVLIDELGQQ